MMEKSKLKLKISKCIRELDRREQTEVCVVFMYLSCDVDQLRAGSIVIFRKILLTQLLLVLKNTENGKNESIISKKLMVLGEKL